MTETVELFIAGEFRPSRTGATYEKRDPSQPSRVATVAADGSGVDMHEALAAATAAVDDWAAMPATTRAGYLRAAAAALSNRAARVAADLAGEVGKPITDSLAEVERAVRSLEYTAGLADDEFAPADGGRFPGAVWIGRKPLGVVGIVSPWNVPIAIAAWKIGPALLAGNTVVVKVASECPRTVIHLAECFAEAGLPAGVLAVLTGVGGEIGGIMITDPRIRAVSWTGNDVGIGARVRDEATGSGMRVQVTLGGINSLVVLADADLSRAVDAAVVGAYSCAGQLRTATRRIFVQEALAAEFESRIAARMTELRCGAASDPLTEVGPVINAVELDVIGAAVEARLDSGDRLVAGGTRLDPASYLYAPTLLAAADPLGPATDDEVFGPVATLYSFRNLDDAVLRANAAPRIISASVFTADPAAARVFAATARAGVVHWNEPTIGAEPGVPFAGALGATVGPPEQGPASLDFFSQTYALYEHEETA